MARNISSGQLAVSNNALNTGIGHITQLADAVSNLGNTNYPIANWVKNIVSTNLGNTAVTNFEAIKNRVAPEITRIWRGAGGAEADIKRDIENISTANSPAQLYGAISQIAGLMESKLQANMKQYSDAMGPSGKDPGFMISPENKEALDKLRGQASGATQQSFTPPPNWQFSKSRNQFSDPQGKLYDMNGNPL